MNYRFASKADYSDYSSGRVIRSYVQLPAFPVRLASEIFQTCIELLKKEGLNGPFTLYDPCCGGGYLLTTLGFLHLESLAEIIGSDIETEAVALTEKNLSLLTQKGLSNREKELETLYEKYQKESHKEALGSVAYLKSKIIKEIPQTTFVADAFSTQDLVPVLNNKQPDIVMADIPYSRQTAWKSAPSDISDSFDLLAALLPVVENDTLIALISPKSQKLNHAGFTVVKQMVVGKRRIRIFRKN